MLRSAAVWARVGEESPQPSDPCGAAQIRQENTLFSTLYLGHRSSIVRPRCDRGFLRSWPLILDWTVGIAYRFGKRLDLIRVVRTRSNGPNSPIPLRPGFLSKEPLDFVIITPPSTVGRSGSGESFQLAPGLLFIHAPSPEF
jgi:hypothetical protein